MKSKKLFIISALLLILTLLSACSSNGDSAAQSEELPYELRPEQVYNAVKTGEVLILDVREIWEYEQGHVPGAVLIPLLEVENRLAEIPKDQHVIVTCRSGNRSSQIAEFLMNHGYTKVHNMQGGILAWNTLNFPIEK